MNGVILEPTNYDTFFVSTDHSFQGAKMLILKHKLVIGRYAQVSLQEPERPILPIIYMHVKS